MILEICANSFESAKAAQDAGADRIELCTELSVGGLTPSFGLLEKVLTELTIPVHVLIRPRSGNFTYTETELDVMLRDIETCKEFGCDGIVSGALTQEHAIDTIATKELIAATATMEFTFHRAFDWCAEPILAFKQLQHLGITRLLSSGQQTTALNGMSLLQKLLNDSDQTIQIMPGGGITAANCLSFKEAGFKMIHFSAARKTQTLITQPKVGMHNPNYFIEGIVSASNIDDIKKIAEKLNN